MKYIDILGMEFGRLKVIDRSLEKTKNNHYKYTCICECGGMALVTASALKSGNTKSCGCLHKQNTSIANNKGYDRKSKEYKTWANIKCRCGNKNTYAYKWYGAKGIKVCDSWNNSFANFLNDMGKAPSKEYSIDRKDNSLGYNKENCRWATKLEQANNCKRNIVFTLGDRKITLKEFLEKTGVSIIKFRYLYYEKKQTLNQILNQFYYE